MFFLRCTKKLLKRVAAVPELAPGTATCGLTPPSFDALPAEIQVLANKSFAELKADPANPSLAFKSLGGGRFQSVRVDVYYRAHL